MKTEESLFKSFMPHPSIDKKWIPRGWKDICEDTDNPGTKKKKNIDDIITGWALYRKFDKCLVLTENNRFDCPVLQEICELIRNNLAGKPLKKFSDDLWNKFTKRGDTKEWELEQDLDYAKDDCQAYMAMEWHDLSREVVRRTMAMAKRRGKVVYAIQAV